MLTTTATNKQTGRVTIKSADLYRIKDGKITEHWDVVDESGMAQYTEVWIRSCPILIQQL
jgi:predicted SnoaL-like aldol condensation-catalyzing enzyme